MWCVHFYKNLCLIRLLLQKSASFRFETIELLFCLQEDTVEYGIDLSGPVCLADDSERVVVPEVPSILNDTQVSLLRSLVNPLESCDDCGKGYYITARQIVRDSIA